MDRYSKIKWKVRARIQSFFNRIPYSFFGEKSIIYKPDRIIGKKYISIGNGVTILQHARIEAIDEYGQAHFSPKITVGDGTSIEQNAHIAAAGDLTIGRNVTISANVYISDCKHDFHELDVDVIKQKLIFDKTEIGDYCFIGYGACIFPGVELGKQCVVGANSVVLKGEYPDRCVLAGVPARIVKKYNEITEKWEDQTKQ